MSSWNYCHGRSRGLVFSAVLAVLLFTLSGCASSRTTTSGEQQQLETKASEQPAPEKVKEQSTPITIRFAHTTPEKHTIFQAAEQFKKNVEQSSNGRVKVQVYPASSLFADKDMNQGVQSGGTELGLTPLSWWANVEPVMSLTDLPFLFPTSKDYFQKMQGTVGKKLAEPTRQYGVETLGWFHSGFINGIGNNVRPVKLPEDIKGLKIRSFGDLNLRMLKALGAVPVSMSSAEVYLGLQRGTIDGVYTSAASWRDRNWMEVCKYLTIVPIAYGPMPFMANAKWWDGLPDDIKKIIQEEVDRSGIYTSELLDILLDEAIKEMQEKSKMLISYVPESDMTVWQEAVQPTYEYFKELAGPRGEELIKLAGQ